MSDQQWYYADRSHQQQGPVSADSLRALHAMKAVDAGTLVWRDGLAGWVPLAQVAREVGIDAVASPPPRPAAAATTGRVVVKPASGGSSTWIIVVVVVAFALIVILGILAAIAIPAYQDYLVRAKVMEARNSVVPIKLAVSESWLSEEVCPGNGDAGIGTPESYATATIAQVNVGTIEDEEACAIQILFKDFGSGTEGEEILLQMDNEGGWTETSTLPDRMLPASLR